MYRAFVLPSAVKHDPGIETWMGSHAPELAVIARHWFAVMRGCGEDVRELVHDGHPTACVTDAAFGYVSAFGQHVNVGFFNGAALADPARLLRGEGKYMRHVRLSPGHAIDDAALAQLIVTAYEATRERLGE